MEYAYAHEEFGLPRNGSVDYSKKRVPYLEALMYECTFGLLSTYVQQQAMLKPINKGELAFDWSRVSFDFYNIDINTPKFTMDGVWEFPQEFDCTSSQCNKISFRSFLIELHGEIFLYLEWGRKAKKAFIPQIMRVIRSQ